MSSIVDDIVKVVWLTFSRITLWHILRWSCCSISHLCTLLISGHTACSSVGRRWVIIGAWRGLHVRLIVRLLLLRVRWIWSWWWAWWLVRRCCLCALLCLQIGLAWTLLSIIGSGTLHLLVCSFVRSHRLCSRWFDVLPLHRLVLLLKNTAFVYVAPCHHLLLILKLALELFP